MNPSSSGRRSGPGETGGSLGPGNAGEGGKNDHAGACYEIIDHEAALVAEFFRRYADDGASLADLTRWLTNSGTSTRTGKSRWDRSVIWGMLRNPAYAGKAVFGKTMVISESAGSTVGHACKDAPHPGHPRPSTGPANNGSRSPSRLSSPPRRRPRRCPAGR